MQKLRKTMLLIACALMTQNAAHAAHPLVTEDANLQTTGKQQIEFNSDHWSTSRAHSQIGSLTYTYGASDQLDLFFSSPIRWSSPGALGDLSVGSKYLFSSQENANWAWKTEVFFPTGAKTFGSDRYDLALTLVRTENAGPWVIHSNLSLNLRQHRQALADAQQRDQLWRTSVAVLRAITPQTQLLADTGIAQADQKNDGYWQPYLVAGVIYSPASNLDLDIGFKYQKKTLSTERQIGIGMAWRF